MKIEHLAALVTLSNRASVLVVDESPFLSSWETKESVDSPDDVVIEASWTDGEHDTVCRITAQNVHEGCWDGKIFCCDDSNGNDTRLAFYELKLVGPDL